MARIIVTKGKEHFPAQEYFVRDTSEDFHIKYGLIRKEDLKKTSGKVKTNTNKEYSIFTPSFIDYYKRMKRGAQIIPLKDIGVILSFTGIGKDSVVMEAGGGSGGFSCFVSQYVKKIVSYEIDDENISLINDNLKYLGIKNVSVKKADVYKKRDEKDFDLILLDLPEPWKAVENASKALKVGGFLVSYSPTITQNQQFVNALTNSLMHVKTIETIERLWKIDKQVVRPVSKSSLHSGFITFARKISE
ncbi:methyltransferase domain-containing protein [Candidatus Woesearchaeota archaeon]|nr:methyltransferase domain-containing protein [Candidatus Woesearchaeota archaeon]